MTPANADAAGYVGYLRRSTSRQELSLEVQRAMIERACRERGWSLLHFMTDDLSGRSLARPGLMRLLEECQRGMAAGIIVAKLDRLTRSVVDLGGLMELAQRGHFNIVALDFGLDLSTPQGELVANLLASVGQWERRIIGQRTSEALRSLPRHRRNGRPVYDDAARDRAKILRASGLTLRGVAQALEAEGVKPPRGGAVISATTVLRLLND